MKTKPEHIAVFIQLLQYVVGSRKEMPEGISEELWAVLYDMALKQSVAGVVFSRIEKIDKERTGIPIDLLMEWIGVAEQIRGQNTEVNRHSAKVAAYFEKRGYRCCLLKGQGNAMMYPQPDMRSSGDIDVWLVPEQRQRRSDEIIGMARIATKLRPGGKICYHHVDAGKYRGVEVEIHYRPSFMNNLIHNHRLQQWFEKQAAEQFAHRVTLPGDAGSVCVPTTAFNIVFQLVHISNHVMHEGIGLRQLMDYYYLLRQADGLSEVEHRETVATLRRLGLWKVAGAVMYVLHEVFGLEERLMLVPADERRGRFLLDEMMAGGNFGQYDERNQKSASQWGKNVQRLRRDVRLMRYFPSECLWEPVFRWYHFFWRLVTELKLKTSYRYR